MFLAMLVVAYVYDWRKGVFQMAVEICPKTSC